MDCGLPEGTSYTEKLTTLNYISDASFISTGVSKSISPQYRTNYQRQITFLRSFPEGIRNCYKISVEKGTKYLIATYFFYGDYDSLNKTPKFDLHMGGNFWATIAFKLATDAMSSEIIYTPLRDYFSLCLVNTGNGTPFINAIEMRPLLNTTYQIANSSALVKAARLDMGSTNNVTYRSVH